MEVQSKPWYESIGIWGAIVGILGTILSFFNITIAPDVQSSIVDGVTQVATGIAAKDYGAILTGVMALVGSIVSVVGRKQADQPVHFWQPYTIATSVALTKPK